MQRSSQYGRGWGAEIAAGPANVIPEREGGREGEREGEGEKGGGRGGGEGESIE